MHSSRTPAHALEFMDEPIEAPHPAGHAARALCRESLAAARYEGDIELLRAIRSDEALVKQLQRTEVLRQSSSIRTRLLSHAVRVHPKLIPNVARSLERVAAVLSTDKPLEAYVFSDPGVQAFVTEANRRYLVGLSSGAVNMLGAEELEFIIGHELGHAAFGHLDVPARVIVDLELAGPGSCRLLQAWQRASEISADRVGLLCCGSLEVAATALFKTICGLDLPGVVIDPREFAQQWDQLAEEMLEHGGREHWKLSHPFPPLRMQALLLFWTGRGQPGTDRQVAHLLAHMDAHRGAGADSRDPLLSRFSFWGSLYMVLADRGHRPDKLQELIDRAPPGVDIDEVLHGLGASQAPELCLGHFREALRTRRKKLTSKELHALISEFVEVAIHRGQLSPSAVTHVTRLGKELGIGADAVRLMINKRLERK